MASINPYLPYLPLPLSLDAADTRDERGRGTPMDSFRLLLEAAANTPDRPLNVSFAETGTIGFEHQLPAFTSHACTAAPQPHAVPAIDADGGAIPAVPITPTHGEAPRMGDHTGQNDPLPKPYAGSASRTLVGGPSTPPARPTRTGSPWAQFASKVSQDNGSGHIDGAARSERRAVEKALSPPAADVSVSMELMDGTLRVHVHLSQCSDEERQRLINRARDMLDERGLAGAELVVHLHDVARTDRLSRERPSHGD